MVLGNVVTVDNWWWELVGSEYYQAFGILEFAK